MNYPKKRSIIRFIKWSLIQLGSKFISIRTKLILSLVFVVILFGTLNLYISYFFVVQSIKEEMAKKGELLLNIAEEQITDAIIVQDYVMLNRFISGIKREDTDILYIVVYNKLKEIIGHTFDKGDVPIYLTNVNFEKSCQHFVDEEHPLYIRQYLKPVFKGKLGYVGLGLDESSIIHKGHKITMITGGMVLLFLIIGVVATIVFSNFITSPIYRVVNGFKQFIPGKPVPKIKVWINDEMKLLADGFTRMMERITALDRESKQTQLKIIETEKLASIGVLASGIAHEINNPTAGIKLCAHRIRKKIPVGNGLDNYIRLIDDATDHIKTIVKDLLKFAHQTEHQEEPVNLCQVIDGAVRLVKYRLKKNRIVLEVMTPQRACMLFGVKYQLVRVVVNGIINALESIEHNGRITITLSESNRCYHLTIQDTGSGVDQTIIGRVFEPFFTTKGSKGTGLGLYVSYNIIQAHNGSVRLISNQQQGAELMIELPKGKVS